MGRDPGESVARGIHSLFFSVLSPYLANADESDHSAGSSKPKKRNLRSSGTFLPAGPTPGRSNVLPKLCIICKKRDKWLSTKGGPGKLSWTNYPCARH